MSWFWTVIFFSFTFTSNCLSEPKHQKKLPTAVVVGTVYCHTCFHQNHPKANNFIPGASVEVECKETRSRRGFREEVKTNSHGEFKIQLPFSVGKHVRKIRGCSVRLIRSNQPFCAVAASATSSSSLHLKSRKEGTHIFSAGFFSFKPQVCDDQKPKEKNFDAKKLSTNSNSKKETDQLPFPLVPNPLNPPTLPPNPLLPPPSILPPNPFQPPPSVIPPIFPTPPPSIFPPILPVPPTPPFFNLPPLPGLVPSPPPPPPPILPIPLPPLIPPFPFQPTPGFPGVPPAEVASQSRTTSP